MSPLNDRQAGMRFLGVRFDRLGAKDALRAVLALAKDERFSFVVTPNVDHLVRLHRGAHAADLWPAYECATLSLCDSRVLQALASLSGVALGAVPGSDLTRDLLGKLGRHETVAVVGGDGGMIDRLRSRYPELCWHHHVPPFGVLHDPAAQAAIIEFVERSPARIILLAIGSPQSELLCAQMARRARAAGVALCIGASLEFLAGDKARAPVWMQKCGLEWLFRLASEPRRLWRRYLLEGPQIFGIWLRWRFSAPRPPAECGSTPSGES